MPAGRPLVYNPEKHIKEAKEFSLLGLTNEEIAHQWSINVGTLYEWQKKYPDLYDALKEGKECADAAVAGALYNKACEGDTTACIYWLKNRRSKNWRDKREIEHSEKDIKLSVDNDDTDL